MEGFTPSESMAQISETFSCPSFSGLCRAPALLLALFWRRSGSARCSSSTPQRRRTSPRRSSLRTVQKRFFFARLFRRMPSIFFESPPQLSYLARGSHGSHGDTNPPLLLEHLAMLFQS